MLQVSNENHIEGILYIPVYDVFWAIYQHMMMFFEKLEQICHLYLN